MGLKKKFGDEVILDGIDVSIEKGEVVVSAWSFRLWEKHISAVHERTGNAYRRENFTGR